MQLGVISMLAIASSAAQGALLPRSGVMHLPETLRFFGRDIEPTDNTCMLPDSADLPKRSLSLENITDPTEHLIPRAGRVRPKPLHNPKSDSDAAFAAFLTTIKGKPGKMPSTTEDIIIVPSDHQVKTWQANVDGEKIPIGATAEYYPFSTKKQDFWMHGLSGCTSVFITAPSGMWALHLWESTKPKTINGGSAFLKRLSRSQVQERSDSEFKAVALDILSELTPKTRAADDDILFKSIADLQEVEENLHPFQDGRDVKIFILTKAKSPKDRSQEYEKKISQLKYKFNDMINGAEIIERTYAFQDPGVPKDMRGEVFVQYTPYEGDGQDGCSPEARVRIFYENNKTPVEDRRWPADMTSLTPSRKRANCPFKPTQVNNHNIARPTWVTSVTDNTKFAAWPGNHTIDIGNMLGNDGGKSLKDTLVKGFLGFCNGAHCDTSKTGKLEALTVVDEGDEHVHDEYLFDEVTVSDPEKLKHMVTAGVATWLGAASKSCKNETYKLPKPEYTDCGKTGHVKRADGSVFLPTAVEEKIEKRCSGDICNHEETCVYTASICTAPTSVEVVMSDDKSNPYANHLALTFRLAKPNALEELLCKLFIDGLTAAAVEYAPELAFGELAEEYKFQAICEDLLDD